MVRCGAAGIFIQRGIEKRMRRKKVGPVSELLEQWNLVRLPLPLPLPLSVLALAHASRIEPALLPPAPHRAHPLTRRPLPPLFLLYPLQLLAPRLRLRLVDRLRRDADPCSRAGGWGRRPCCGCAGDGERVEREHAGSGGGLGGGTGRVRSWDGMGAESADATWRTVYPLCNI